MINDCPHPWEGITINPQGYITPCCMLPNKHAAHIDDVTSLTDTYVNHPFFIEYRNSIPKACSYCYEQEAKGVWTAKNTTPLSGSYNKNIRYLEYTMSNLCNATCSMCGPYFSSSWVAHDKKYSVSTLSESAFKKILDVLPYVQHLVIKGGEPFLDKKNLIVLEKFLRESTGRVDIITNGSLINEVCFDSRVHLAFSIDGTHDVYRWIRSTDWDTVIDNAKKFYDATGKGVSVESCISLHNFFHVEEYYNFFIDAPYVMTINQNHFADIPRKCSIHCLPDDILMDQKDKNLRIIDKYKNNPKINSNNYLTMDSIKPRVDSTGKCTKENAFKHIDYINGIRGFDLLDHVPELKEWKGT